MEIDRPSTTVFYDGSCQLCRAEIGHYGRQTGSTALSFVDVSFAHTRRHQRCHYRSHPATGHGKVPCAVTDRRLISGAAAFVEVRKTLSRWHWAANRQP